MLVSAVLSHSLLRGVNDGWFAYHGNPASVDGKHPSIRMVSEDVKVTVNGDSSDVVTHFVFQNTGAATKVRMGFPDGGSNDDGEEAGRYKSGVMTLFRSTVDGRPVKTRFVSEEGLQKRFSYPRWQVKDVSFDRGQVRRVRNTYRVSHGRTVAWGPPGFSLVSYIVRTGLTWKSTIKSAKFTFVFTKDAVPNAPEFLSERTLGADPVLNTKFWKAHPRAVVYSPLETVRADARTITFSVKDFVPKEDIILSFGP